MMKNRVQLALIVFVLVTISGCPYHKPPFMGKVIDAETKEPIEGAVAVVVYNKTAMGVGAGNVSYAINVRESLTDKDGVFQIPSYITVVFPFTWETEAEFIIFKPGYGNYPEKQSYPPGLSLTDQETFFSASIGAEKLMRAYLRGFESEYMTLKTGVVELPRLSTREERRRASSVGVTGFTENELPLLYKARKEEDKALEIK